MVSPAIDTSSAHEARLQDLDHQGRHMINTIHEFLKIDEEWTQWHDDGFTWWAHQLAQRFRVEGPEIVDGIPTYWVSFETSVLRHVPAEDRVVAAMVTVQNRVTNLYTAQVAGDRLIHWGRTYALPETATQRARLLAERAIMSVASATTQAYGLAELLRQSAGLAGVEGDASEHPVQGLRAVPDDMLNVIDRVYALHGAFPLEPHKAPDLGALAAMARRRDLEVLSEDERRLGILGAAGGLPYVLEIDLDVRHPALGYGMLVRLNVPVDSALELEAVTDLTGKLNDAERVTKRPLVSLGSWTAAGSEAAAGQGGPDPLRLIHAAFYPKVSLGHPIAELALADALQRVGWLGGALATG